MLGKLGIRTFASHEAAAEGFPAVFHLASGEALTFDLTAPVHLEGLDRSEVGLAVFDPLGYPKAIWGLASSIPFIQKGQNVFESPLASLMEEGGALYHDGVRYYTSGVAGSGSDVHLLVINAYEEKKARRQAAKGWRTANTLRRLGKALTSTQNVQHLCVAAAHEISSTTNLAAVLIWAVDATGQGLDLKASIGVNRKGRAAVEKLAIQGGTSCLAEFVAEKGQGFFVDNVKDHLLTANLEANFCYLKPKGLFAIPLHIGERVLGVIEMIGKEDDPHFEDDQDLFQTVAEHLTLALHSAQLYEIAERSASHDALTGIPNHRSLQRFLQTRLMEAERTGTEVAAIMIDVDHFRRFNEEEGHDAGDEVLKLVASTLKECVRPYDLAARYGGEEFTLLLPGTNKEGVLAIAERARSSVEEIVYKSASGARRPVTISLGCAVFPHSATDSAGLLKAADTALYEAKRSGRNQVAWYQGLELGQAHSEGIDLKRIKQRLRSEDRAAAEGLLLAIGADLEELGRRLALSEKQVLKLRGLLYVLPAYTSAIETRDFEAIESIEGAEEFRCLEPSLSAYVERYDGAGPKGLKATKIPLLARVAQVLIAKAENRLETDPVRFDPEIMALLAGRQDAA